MYKSPIDIMVADIQHQIAKQQDEEIYKAVVSVGINVDKDELIRALHYDRHQYMKGYADAMASIVHCKDCKHYDNSEGIFWCHLNSKFYPGGFDWHSFPEDGFCSYGERKDHEASQD